MLVGKDRYEFKQELKEGEFSFAFRKKRTRGVKKRETSKRPRKERKGCIRRRKEELID